MSWTRELERLSCQVAADRAELARRGASAEALALELRRAEDELEAAVDEAALSAHARELLADEVRALREQLADSGAPRYAEATHLAHRAKAAVAARDERIEALEAELERCEAELASAREALSVGGQLAHELRRTGLELDERARELADARADAADARAETFRVRNELAQAARRADELEDALREAHGRLQAGVDRSRQHAMRAIGEDLRAELAAAAAAALPGGAAGVGGGHGAREDELATAAYGSRRTTLNPHAPSRLTSL